MFGKIIPPNHGLISVAKNRGEKHNCNLFCHLKKKKIKYREKIKICIGISKFYGNYFLHCLFTFTVKCFSTARFWHFVHSRILNNIVAHILSSFSILTEINNQILRQKSSVEKLNLSTKAADLTQFPVV